MKKWISLFTLLLTLTSLAQSGYNYSFTDPCTLSTKSVFVPTGSGVMVNYFDNHSTFTALDFSSGVFDAWIAQVSQQNSSSPCSQVTTVVTNNVTSIVVSNTVGIVTNVVAISSLAQSMASISSSIGSSMSATAGGISNTGIGNAVDNNQSNSNGKSDSKDGGSTGSTGGNQTNNQNEGGTTPSTTTGGNSNPAGGTGTGQGGNTSDTNQPTQGGEQTSESSVGGSTANSVSNSIDGGGSEGGSSSGGTSSSSKKQANAKTSSGSLIASGDMVAISSADGATANQYKIVASMTHANTRGTRIKGILFNFTTGANNMNVTLYKSYINKSKSLNLIVANSTMMDFDKNIFNTTTGLESYKVNKSLTGMFGLNFTAGKMGERGFYNLSAVGGGHISVKVTDRTSTSFLVLAIYSPFTQFYDGKWFGAGILFVPFSSWDFKITKTFKYNISFTGVYEMNKSFLNYQILTGGKLSF